MSRSGNEKCHKGFSQVRILQQCSETERPRRMGAQGAGVILVKWLAWPCIGPRPAFWKKSCPLCQSWRNPCGLDARFGTNPVVGLIVFLCAVRIRDLVVLVVLVDEVQQNRAALEQPDSLAAGLVRDGRNPPVWVDLQKPVFLFEWSASVLVTFNKLQPPLTFCVFLDKSMAVVCSTRQHNVTHRLGPRRR